MNTYSLKNFPSNIRSVSNSGYKSLLRKLLNKSLSAQMQAVKLINTTFSLFQLDELELLIFDIHCIMRSTSFCNHKTSIKIQAFLAPLIYAWCAPSCCHLFQLKVFNNFYCTFKIGSFEPLFIGSHQLTIQFNT